MQSTRPETVSADWRVALLFEVFFVARQAALFFSSASSPKRSPPIVIKLMQNAALGKCGFRTRTVCGATA
jgi:hypothetical protein